MRFYTKQHKFYCGIDLHTKKMYLCILDDKGEIKLHRNLITDCEVFLKTIHPFREDIVVAVECMFNWYWVSDLCTQEGIPFRLQHLNESEKRRRICVQSHQQKTERRKQIGPKQQRLLAF